MINPLDIETCLIELEGITATLSIVSDDLTESSSTYAEETLSNAIYSIANHIDRVKAEIYNIIEERGAKKNG